MTHPERLNSGCVMLCVARYFQPIHFHKPPIDRGGSPYGDDARTVLLSGAVKALWKRESTPSALRAPTAPLRFGYKCPPFHKPKQGRKKTKGQGSA